MSPRDIDRFWERVDRDGPNGCWSWRSYYCNGYAMLWAERRNMRAHRISYELVNGPIPQGLVIDHLCRNPGCVNPDHLEAVTNRVNTLRGRCGEVNRARLASKTHCLRGHPRTPENTKINRTGHRNCLVCARTVLRERANQKRNVKRAALRALGIRRRS